MSKLKKILLLFTTIIILLVIGLYLFLNLNNTTTNKSNASENKIEDKYNNEGLEAKNKKTLELRASETYVEVNEQLSFKLIDLNAPKFNMKK